MNTIHFSYKANKILALVAFCLTIGTLRAKAGIDSYEIYLNNQLLLRQSVLKPFNLQNLPLQNAKPEDQLIIKYSQCNAPDKCGKGRSLLLKDAAGKVVKEWKFADAAGDNTMVIPMKELLPLLKSNTLGLYYVARDRPNGQILADLSGSLARR